MTKILINILSFIVHSKANSLYKLFGEANWLDKINNLYKEDNFLTYWVVDNGVKMAKYKIIHIKKDCISCGACAAVNPEFWLMDDEGMAHLKGSKEVSGNWGLIITTEEARATNQEAVDVCPV